MGEAHLPARALIPNIGRWFRSTGCRYTIGSNSERSRGGSKCVHLPVPISDVTQGRYTDARVDPGDLSVQVLGADNEWRDARHLSHGTAEQIYLLLRVVLAERLATTGETCPLILDDVLVQSDRLRKRALLDVMLSISRTRQVILFTQEEEVLTWAQEHVLAPNAVVVLANTRFEQGAIASL